MTAYIGVIVGLLALCRAAVAGDESTRRDAQQSWRSQAGAPGPRAGGPFAA